MKKERGFTLIELMVVVAILGVLGATAMPLYNTWQQRAYGSEAIVMIKQLTEGQILYYLEHDDYFPGSGDTYQVLKDGTTLKNAAADPDVIEDIKDALKLTITPNGRLDYIISNNANNTCTITIQATFPLFRNGQTNVIVLLNEKGFVEYFGFDDFG